MAWEDWINKRKKDQEEETKVQADTTRKVSKNIIDNLNPTFTQFANAKLPKVELPKVEVPEVKNQSMASSKRALSGYEEQSPAPKKNDDELENWKDYVRTSKDNYVSNISNPDLADSRISLPKLNFGGSKDKSSFMDKVDKLKNSEEVTTNKKSEDKYSDLIHAGLIDDTAKGFTKVAQMVHYPFAKASEKILHAIDKDSKYTAENDLVQKGLKDLMKNQEAHADSLDPTDENTPTLEKYMNMTARTLPNIMASGMMGGQLGELEKVKNLGKFEEAIKMLPFMTEAGGQYSREAEQQGGDYATQLKRGLIGAGVEGASEMVGMPNWYKKLLGGGLDEVEAKTIKEALKELGKDTLKEGSQEALADPVMNLADKFIMPNQQDKKLYGDNGIIDPKQMKDDFLSGALIGGVGGVPSTMGNIQNIKYKEQLKAMGIDPEAKPQADKQPQDMTPDDLANIQNMFEKNIGKPDDTPKADINGLGTVDIVDSNENEVIIQGVNGTQFPIRKAIFNNVAMLSAPQTEEAQPKASIYNDEGVNVLPTNDNVIPLPAPKNEVFNTPKIDSKEAESNIKSVPLKDINVDPERFQFKGNTDSEGVTNQFKNGEKFNKNMAGIITLWRDNNNKLWVVNGHHRVEFANRSGVDSLNAQILDEKDGWDEKDVRTLGAKINIADGKGTAIDSAKIFKENDMSIEDLKKEGLSLNRNKVKTGFYLSKLENSVFDKVVNGEISESKGAIIGKSFPNDKANQEALMKVLNDYADKGKNISDSAFKEVIKKLVKGGKYFGENNVRNNEASSKVPTDRQLPEGEGQQSFFKNDENKSTRNQKIEAEQQAGATKNSQKINKEEAKPVNKPDKSSQKNNKEGKKYEKEKSKEELEKQTKEALSDLKATERNNISSAGRKNIYVKGVKGLAISPQLIANGRVDLVGQVIDSPEKLATISQVYRDPRFETFRIFYMKGDTIVGHEGVSSKIPNMVVLNDGTAIGRDRFYRGFRNRMNSMGADGYYILHNHPSGNPEPSKEDFNMTNNFINEIKGFKGHVIIDSNKFAHIYENNPIEHEIKDLNLGEDKLLSPSIDHPLLNKTISSPTILSEMAKTMEMDKNMHTIVYVTAKNGVRAIQEVPDITFKNYDLAVRYLTNRMKEFGAVHVFVVSGLRTNNDKNLRQLITNGIALDIVYKGNDMTFRNLGNKPSENISSNTWNGEKGKPFKVMETQENYNQDLEKKAIEYFGTTSNFKEAGYLTTSGKLLDFSGKKQGARGGYRTQDHREVQDIMDSEGTQAMTDFMDLGNIRLQETGFELTQKPTDKQIPMLKRLIDRLNGEVNVDLSLIGKHNSAPEYKEYPEGTKAEKIFNDIKSFYDTGKVNNSIINQFHEAKEEYKVSKENHAIELYNSGLSQKEIGEMLDTHPSTVRYWLLKNNVEIRQHIYTQPRIAPKTTQETKDKIVKAYKEGKTYRDIIKDFKVSVQTITKSLKEAGYEERHIHPNTYEQAIKDEVIRLYTNDEMSTGEIAKRLNISVSVVARTVKKEGITRSASDRMTLRNQNKNYVIERGISSPWQSSKTNEWNFADSSYEIVRMSQLDNDPNVTYWTKKVERVPYGENRYYLPDFYIEYKNGSKVVEEVKAEWKKEHPKTIEKSIVAKEYFAKKGIQYKILTENDIGKENIENFDFDSIPNLPNELKEELRKEKRRENQRKRYAKKKLETKNIIESPSFKKWFGDSKVVDEEGQPLKVYHGTTKSFNEFDKNKIGYGNVLGNGFYFATSSESADMYSQSEKEGSSIIPVYLSIKNPIDSRNHILTEAELKGLGIDSTLKDLTLQSIIDKKLSTFKTLREDLQKLGYDGIKEDGGELSKLLDSGETWVAFEPSQIKSAIGNNGEFDLNNPNILEEEKAGYENTDPIEAEIQTIKQNLASGKVPTELIESVVARMNELRRSQAEKEVGTKERKHAETYQNSEAMRPEVKIELAKKDTTYKPISNKDTWEKALDYVYKNYERAYSELKNLDHLRNADDTARAEAILYKMQKEGRYTEASDWASEVVTKSTNTAQALQALSIWGKLSPEGILRTAQRELHKASTDFQRKTVDDKAKGVAGEINGANDDVLDEVGKRAEEFARKKKIKGRKSNVKNTEEEAPEVATDEEGTEDVIDRNKNNKGTDYKGYEENKKKKKPTPDEKLAKQVSSHVEQKKGKIEENPVEDMIRTLYKVAKENLPEKEKENRNPMELVTQAIKNKAQYKEIWDKAQEIVKAKFENDPDSLLKLEQYFGQYLEKPFHEKDLEKAIKVSLKELNIDLGKLVKEHYSKVNAVGKTLEEKLADSGLDKAEAKELADYIKDQFEKMTSKKKEQILKRMFGSPKTKKQKMLFEKIIEWSNLGALSSSQFKGYIADKLKIPAMNDELAKDLIDRANFIQTMEEGEAKTVEIALMLDRIAQEIPSTIWQKVSTTQAIFQLLNPKTYIRNKVGNSLFATMDRYMTYPFAKMFDLTYRMAHRTGEGTIAMPNPFKFREGYKEGKRTGKRNAKLGIDTSTVGNSRIELSHTVFRKETAKGIEKILQMHRLETALRVSLGATDEAYKQATIRESLYQQMKLAGVNEPTEAMTERAKNLADYRTFQNDSTLASLFSGLKQLLNNPTYAVTHGAKGKKRAFGMGDVLIKYPKVPANLLNVAIDYSPLGVAKLMYKAYDQAKSGGIGQFNFAMGMSRAVAGTGMIALGYALASLGLLSGRGDNDEDLRNVQEDTGYGQYRFNVTAFMRYVNTGKKSSAEAREGDTTINYDWLQPNGLSLAIGSDLAKSHKILGQDTALSIMEALSSGANTITEQPLMQGIKRVAQSRDIVTGLSDSVKGVPASFVPSILNQVKQLGDNTSRSTYGKSYGEEMINLVKSRTPLASESLLPRIDNFGHNKKTYQNNSNNLFNVFLNPAFVKKYKPTDEQQLVLDIFKDSGNKIQVPRIVDKTITFQGETIKLTPKEYRDYQREVGQRAEAELSKIPAMANDSDKQAQKIKSILDKINEEAKKEILREHGINPNRKKPSK